MKDKTISLKHYWRIFLQKNKLCFVTAVIGIMLISIFDLIFSLVMAVAYLLVYYIYSYTKTEFIRKATMNYKQVAFEKITKKTISSFNNESTSTYISALTNDISVIETNYIKSIFTYINLLFVFFGALGVMLFYHVGLTLILLVVATVPIILSFLLGNRLVETEKKFLMQTPTL